MLVAEPRPREASFLARPLLLGSGRVRLEELAELRHGEKPLQGGLHPVGEDVHLDVCSPELREHLQQSLFSCSAGEPLYARGVGRCLGREALPYGRAYE